VDYYKQAVEYLEENGIDISIEEKASGCPPQGCPGSAMRDFREDVPAPEEQPTDTVERQSQLSHWPVQLMLVPVNAPYFNGAEVVIAADCVPFALPDFHEKFLKGKILLIGCPKLDDAAFYKNKLTEIFSNNNIRSVTVVHMEVPCCSGLLKVTQAALDESGKVIPYASVEIGIKGDVKS